MPRSLEPGTHQPLVLEADKGKTPEPTFFARSLSIRDFREIVGTLSNIAKSTDKVDQMNEAMSRVCRVITGWQNMIDPHTKEEIPFSTERLEETIDLMEAIELLGQIVSMNQLGVDDRKKSE